MTINFIGCGRLGKTIARLFQLNGSATIGAVLNSTYGSSLKAVEFVGAGLPIENLKDMPSADIYFITTKDDCIGELCHQLVKSHLLKKDAIIVHCSGSLSSDILEEAHSKGCHVASIHPVKSFANSAESVKTFLGTYCAIEGDPEAVQLIEHLFAGIGGKVFGVNKENKSLYHAASVMANNYLVALHYHAVQCYLSSGLDETIAKNIANMMMNDALKNLANLSHQQALTGPIQRGDAKTVSRHVESLSDHKMALDIYCKLGVGTLPLTEHSPAIKEELEAILQPMSPPMENEKISYSGEK